jgi:hypothetical protein
MTSPAPGIPGSPGSLNTLRDRVVLLLINGMSPEAAQTYCLQQNVAPDQAQQIVREARNRITVAADFTRDEQIGRAVMRLDDLYAKSIAGQDTRTALQAQRELNRLLSLYAPKRDDLESEGVEDATALRRQLDLIAAYLLPLNLASDHYPVEEHARLAADILRKQGHTGLPPHQSQG